MSHHLAEPDSPPATPPLRTITPDMLAATPAPVPVATGAIDFEKGMSRAPVVTLSIAAVLIGVLAWELATGATESLEAIIAAGALYRPAGQDGQWWRILTATLLHADIGHLIGNLVGLYIFGMGLEHGIGRLRFGWVYAVSGIAGSLLSLVMSEGPSVGASGAIFGLCGGLVVFLYRNQRHFIVRDKRIGFVLLFWAAYQVIEGFLTPGIDNFAHIGGFVGGAAAVLPFRPARCDTQPAGS